MADACSPSGSNPTSSSRTDRQEGKVGLFRDVWQTKCWRIFPLLFVYVTSLTLLMPLKPDLMTDFFASRHSPHYVRCEHYPIQHQPKACKDAHGTVVMWSSFADFFSNSFLLFLLAPLVGRWSDAYGRRLFLAMTFFCASGPVLVLFLNLHFHVSMLYYFPAQAVNGALSSFSLCMAYASDLLQVDNRAPAFGLILSSYSVGILVGPMGGGYIPPKIASYLALGGLVSCVLMASFMIPESTTKEGRMQARNRQNAEPRGSGGSLSGFRILLRSRLFIKLTVAVMLTGIVTEGMYELIMQYFQIKLGFQAKDQSNMFVLAGLCGMFTQLVLLRLLVRYVGKSRMLLVGLSASLLQQVCMTLVWNKPTALAAMCIGSIGNLSFPAISSIKSINVLESEQGAVQGALQGARALAQGLGPLAFAGIFSLFTKSSSPLPYFPGAPFVFGAILMFIALIVAATVDRTKADTTVQHTAAAEALLHEPLLAGDARSLEHDEENPPELKGPLPPNYILQHTEAAMLLDQVPEGADEAMLSLAAKGGLSSMPAKTGPGYSEAAEQEGSSGSSADLTEGAYVRPSDSASSQLGQCMPKN